MKKSELVSELKKASGASSDQVEKMLDALEACVESAMKKKEKLQFGHLLLEGITVPAKSGIAPFNGKPYSNPAYDSATVKFSPAFKSNLKGK
jgi:nucleoid DNA-binding protein